jgi:hypothetical protein
MPPMAWMPTTAPEPVAASASRLSSTARPVNAAMSRGMVRMAPATPPTENPAAGDRPRAASSNASRTDPVSRSASASKRAVSLRVVRVVPRSRSLTDRALMLARSASSSWVIPAWLRSRRSSCPKLLSRSSATAPPPQSMAPALTRLADLKRP